MIDFLKKYKVAIGLLVVAGIGFWAYSKFFTGENKVVIISPQPIGQEIIETLEQIRLISLDISVINSPIFSSLEDYSLNIISGQIGRENPFAPVSPQTAGPVVGRFNTTVLPQTISTTTSTTSPVSQ